VIKWIVNTYRKSEAAVVVQNLLEEQGKNGMAAGIRNYNPAEIANALVESVFRARMDYFNGHYGYRPHKIVFAAAALAHGISNAKSSPPPLGPLYSQLLFSLTAILSHLERDGQLYRFNSIDATLIKFAVGILEDASNAASSSPLGKQLAEAGLMGLG